MKLDIPDYLVLLSDYGQWTAPMNFGYLCDSEEDDDEFTRWHESLGISYWDVRDWCRQSPEIELVRERVVASWDKMLGVKPVSAYWDESWKNREIQGVFWEIRSEYVLSAEFFPRKGAKE